MFCELNKLNSLLKGFIKKACYKTYHMCLMKAFGTRQNDFMTIAFSSMILLYLA